MNETPYPEPVSELLTLGDVRGQREWQDYRALGIGPEHIPALIRMALDEALNNAPGDSDDVWAPLHAWRALGQLRAEEASKPLTGLLHRIDEHNDDWVNEELPIVFGMMGPAAIPALSDYLSDDDNGLMARGAAAHGLVEIATRHPEARAACVEALEETLRRYEDLHPTLNGFIVAYLVDLRAVEAAGLMKRAFEADNVDETIRGGWEEVRMELGLWDGPTMPRSWAAWIKEISSRIEEAPPGTPGEQAERRLNEIGRNDPCWCGSGRKYKSCHLREDRQLARG